MDTFLICRATHRKLGIHEIPGPSFPFGKPRPCDMASCAWGIEITDAVVATGVVSLLSFAEAGFRAGNAWSKNAMRVQDAVGSQSSAIHNDDCASLRFIGAFAKISVAESRVEACAQ